MKAKENILSVKWSKKEQDFMINYPRRCDGALVNQTIFESTRWGGFDGRDKGWLNYEEFNLLEELEKRGYDKTTFKLEIKLL